jgi:hypothetical protein
MDFRIFELVLSDHASRAVLKITAGRTDGEYYLDFGPEFFPLNLPMAEARSLAASIRKIDWWLRDAKARKKTATPRAVYRRNVGDGVAPPQRIELGFAEDNALYIEVGNRKIVCNAEQTDDLVFFLKRFAGDVDAIDAMSEPRPGPYSAWQFYAPKWMPHWD